MSNMNKEIRFETETITVEWAIELLKGNVFNRPVSKPQLAYLCKCLLNDEWKLNGDSIRISPDNELLDGQHRLLAVIETGIPIRTCVAYNVPKDTFDTIDSGIKTRRASDVLAMRGEINSKRLASAVRIYHIYKEKLWKVQGGRQLSHQTIQKVLDENPQIRSSVALTMHHKNDMRRLGFESMFSACHAMFADKSKNDAELFLDKLATGAELKDDSPIMSLRKAMGDNRMSTRKFNQHVAVAMTIRTWNAFKQDQPLQHLKTTVTNATFPEVK